MTLETENDLERKMEKALAVRLQQHPMLAKVRMRHTSEESAKVNQDIVISAKRGEGNPQFSGVFNMEITATLTMRYRKTINTLPLFVALCKAMEDVFVGVPTYTLAAQLSLCAGNFHCYEITATDKDDTPQDGKHSCKWTLSAIAMSQSYAMAAALQSQNLPPND